MEYPKILFIGGWDKLDDYVIVLNSDEEEVQRANGYGDLSEERQADAPRRRGRPPKEAQ